jgi:hypothetical protein
VDRDHLLTNVSIHWLTATAGSSWSELDRGGHLAALEAPGFLVGDVRAFFRGLRAA